MMMISESQKSKGNGMTKGGHFVLVALEVKLSKLSLERIEKRSRGPPDLLTSQSKVELEIKSIWKTFT